MIFNRASFLPDVLAAAIAAFFHFEGKNVKKEKFCVYSVAQCMFPLPFFDFKNLFTSLFAVAIAA